MNVRACRVCGFIDGEADPPWGEDGQSPTFDFCRCCGVEFGYQDLAYESMKRYRQKWLQNGAIWNDPTAKPAGWNIVEQLENVSPDEESLHRAIGLFYAAPLR